MASNFEQSKYAKCLSYINEYWPQIIRFNQNDEKTLIGLPGKYLVANHEMFCELYYWDSYFMSVGLAHTEHAEIVLDITDNLLYLMNRFGRIPNTSRFYHLSRSQPPFLTSMILLSQTVRKRSDEWLLRAYQTAKDEYFQVWRGTVFPDFREVLPSLSRYYDLDIWHDAAEAESGWDMTPRFEERCLDFIPIDLNCLLYKYERDFEAIAEMLSLDAEAAEWNDRAITRQKQIHTFLWSDKAGYFFDYDFVREQQSTFYSIAGFFALFSGVATTEQAKRMVDEALPQFEHPFGVVTTEEWHPEQGAVGKQWAWPNGWAPLHWIVVAGLDRCGYKEEARRIAAKWLEVVNNTFRSTGCNFEKYNVVDGTRAVPDRYPDQPGFGWTNAIFKKFFEYLTTGAL